MCKITVLYHTVVFTKHPMDLCCTCYLIFQFSVFGSCLESLIRVIHVCRELLVTL